MGIIDKIANVVSKEAFGKIRIAKKRGRYIEKPKQEVNQLKKYGNAGRLEIPELSIGVALYDTRVGTAQQIVDNPESAVLLRWEAQKAIADHSSQSNFANLNRARPYGTVMYLDSKGGARERYLCVSSQVGHIKTDEHGTNSIYDGKWESPRVKNKGGICIYTCIQRSAPNIMDIRLTYWRLAKNQDS